MQHGVVAKRQLTALGATRWWLEKRLERGTLLEVHRHVYAVGHRREDAHARWMAAVLAGGPGALLSHLDAGVLYRLLKPHGGPVHVLQPGPHRRPLDGIVLHRCRELDRADRGTKDGIPVTLLPRTCIDLADVLEPAPFAAAVERVPHLDVRAFTRALDRHPGRRGTGSLRRLLRAYDPRARSWLERTFMRLVAEHGLPAPLLNARHATGNEHDCHWPDRGLVIELDGAQWHRTRAQQSEDARRAREVGKRGERLFRFSFEQVTLDPEGTMRDLAALLAA